MSRKVVIGHEAVGLLASGISLASKLSGITFGPDGGHIALHRANDAPFVTKHGLTAIRELSLGDARERIGVELIKDAGTRLHYLHGDGSGTYSILVASMCGGVERMLASGYTSNSIVASLRAAHKKARALLEAMRRDAVSPEALVSVAERAGGGDGELATIVGQAVAKAGPNGMVTVSFSQSVDTTVSYAGGMTFNHGMYSRDLLGNETAVRLERPLILLCEDAVEHAAEVIPALEMAHAEQRPLLVIAEKVSGQAHATLLANLRAGNICCGAVKGPGSGIYRHAMTSDLALMTGGAVVGTRLGRGPASVLRPDLGGAELAVIDTASTRIIEGHGAEEAVADRIRQLRDAHAHEEATYERGKLAERLARLSAGVVNIRVGAVTEAAWKERYRRAESMVSAARSALMGGLIPGGGAALHHAAAALRESAGRDAVTHIYADALDAPIAHIIRRSGRDPATVLASLDASGPDAGFDARQRAIVEGAAAAALADPFTSIVAALDSAASIAEQFARVGCVVSRSRVLNRNRRNTHD